MAITIKRGAKLKVTLELTPEEWAAVYPWESIRAEAQQAQVEHEMTVTVDVPARTLLLTLHTQPVALGRWFFDVRAERGLESVFLPTGNNLEFSVVEGVTE